jgi:hypothetical protein
MRTVSCFPATALPLPVALPGHEPHRHQTRCPGGRLDAGLQGIPSSVRSKRTSSVVEVVSSAEPSPSIRGRRRSLDRSRD